MFFSTPLAIWTSRLTGIIAGFQWPSFLAYPLLKSFARFYQINLSEAEKPLSDYRSFDSFFTRKLRPDARPTDPRSNAFVSPVDGRITTFGSLDNDSLLQAKGVSYTVSDLIPDEISASFVGGHYMTFYLSPQDCHRIFSPVSGQVMMSLLVPGRLLPVREPYISNTSQLYTKNERLITILDTLFGKVALVNVGALNVGSITVPYDETLRTNQYGQSFIKKTPSTPISVSKGSHVGTFHLGSSVILLMQSQDFKWEPGLSSNASIRYGASIGRVT